MFCVKLAKFSDTYLGQTTFSIDSYLSNPYMMRKLGANLPWEVYIGLYSIRVLRVNAHWNNFLHISSRTRSNFPALILALFHGRITHSPSTRITHSHVLAHIFVHSLEHTHSRTLLLAHVLTHISFIFWHSLWNGGPRSRPALRPKWRNE